MHRLIVAILAAVDAAIAVAVGVAATLAPVTLLWVFGLGVTADWGALWPAGAVIWQFGNLVPLAVTIPAEYVAVAGIDPDAASFTLSLAPLAFATFTAIFAARSGVRASQADAWITGVILGSATFAALGTLVALTSANGVAGVALWQAVLFPTLVFAVPALLAAVVTEWREASGGAIARLRDRVEAAPHGWAEAPGLVARGTAVVVAGLVGLGALLITVALVLRGGEIIALYEAAHLDVLGAIVMTLGQLAYLPTLVVWGIAFIAGPGFALGTETSVSPAGTQVGVVPGIPLLGIVPESTTPWLLLLALGPIALGALAGWIARSRLNGVGAPRTAREGAVQPSTGSSLSPSVSTKPAPDAATEFARTSALAGLLAASVTDLQPDPGPQIESADEPSPTAVEEPIGARLVVALGIAVLSAVAAAVLAAVASGSFGPGRLAVMGPTPGPVALAIGLEVLLGAGILLLSPWNRRPTSSRGRKAPVSAAAPAAPGGVVAAETAERQSVGDPGGPPPIGSADVALPEDEEAPAAAAASDTDGTRPAPARGEAKPREPFTFPTLPRMTGTRGGAAGGADAGSDPGTGSGSGSNAGRGDGSRSGEAGEDAPVD